MKINNFLGYYTKSTGGGGNWEGIDVPTLMETPFTFKASEDLTQGMYVTIWIEQDNQPIALDPMMSVSESGTKSGTRALEPNPTPSDPWDSFPGHYATDVSYSDDGGKNWYMVDDWIQIAYAGQEIMFSGQLDTEYNGGITGPGPHFEIRYGTGSVFGNISSISYSNWGYIHMFDGCTNLTDVSRLILPETSVDEEWQYRNMFDGCTNIK